MSWELAPIVFGLGVTAIFLWFATKQSDNWFGGLMKVLFVITGMFVLMSTGATNLAVLQISNSTLALSSADYTTYTAGSLGVYKILQYVIISFASFFLLYYLYEILMTLQAFIERRRRRKLFGDDEQDIGFGGG